MEMAQQIFQGLEVRAMERGGEFWFAAVDVATILKLGNPRSSLALLDDDERGVHSMDTLGGAQELAIISESGLYSMILRSRRPEARPFRRWVTHDLLPTLRRTGFYSLREAVVTPHAIARAYGVATKNVPYYMEHHEIHPVGYAENPDTGRPVAVYPRQPVMEKFMLGSGMRPGFELRAYSGAWEVGPIPPEKLPLSARERARQQEDQAQQQALSRGAKRGALVRWPLS